MKWSNFFGAVFLMMFFIPFETSNFDPFLMSFSIDPPSNTDPFHLLKEGRRQRMK